MTTNRFREGKPSDIFWGVLIWGTISAMLGTILYGFLIFSLPVMIATMNAGKVAEALIGVVVFAFIPALFGAVFGAFVGIFDGFVLTLLMTTGVFKPRTNRLHDGILTVISTVITVVGTILLLRPNVSPDSRQPFLYYVSPVIIAAVGGAWVAHYVLTNLPKPRRKTIPLPDIEL